jgi:serine/threonine protein kinase
MALQQTHELYDLKTPEEEGVLPTGTVLQQRYKILGTRKIGGMAIVYKAQDLRFEKASRICAVKEMYNNAPDPRLRDLTVEHFDREANILASLSHPAIPSVLDYFSEGTRIYMVMDFVEGQDLDELIEQSPEPLPQDQVVDWAIQICDVLNYLHHHEPEPIIFRDLKPTNIMLNQHGRIMVIDFGIAKVFEGGQRGTMIGTAGYPPPEQYRGAAEPRGDIYALGATMHHLLTKRDPRLEPPFTFHEHPIRSLNPKVPESLDKIVMKALEYDIDKRFATAQEFKEALQTQVIRDNGLATGPAGQSTVAFATSMLAPVPSGQVVPIWEFACEDEVRSSPAIQDGIVYIGSYDHNLYAIDAEKGTFIWKFPTEAGISSSPCVWEDLVLMGSEDHLLYAVRCETGHIAWSSPTRDRIRSSPRVAMAHVFFGSDDHCLYNLDIRNGREVWKFETESYVRSSPAVSEEMVYFGSDDTNVYAIEIRTNRIKWKFSTNRPVLSSPLLYEGLLFFGSMDWHFYAVDAQAGWSVWQYRTRNWVVSSPAISKSLGLVFVGSVDHNVYAFDYSKGTSPIWTFETDGPVTTSSPAVTAEAVYIGSGDGYLYSLDARTGELRWKFDTGASVVSNPIIWENKVFIGSRNHRLYALPL